MANVHVALLRGINVGGNNMLPMKALAEEFEAAGCEQVQTYIQSGNVVFAANARLATKIGPTMEERIRRRFKLEVPVVVRSADELRTVITANPYAKRRDFEMSTHVMFCGSKLKADLIAKLDPNRSPGDEFGCKEQEIYLWLPNGAGKSKLMSGYFDRVLETVATARNWRTVLKLAEMIAEVH